MKKEKRYSLDEKELLLMALDNTIERGEHSRRILTDREEIDELLNSMRLLKKKLKKDLKKYPF
jgi:hypothetical protein